MVLCTCIFLLIVFCRPHGNPYADLAHSDTPVPRITTVSPLQGFNARRRSPSACCNFQNFSRTFLTATCLAPVVSPVRFRPHYFSATRRAINCTGNRIHRRAFLACCSPADPRYASFLRQANVSSSRLSPAPPVGASPGKALATGPYLELPAPPPYISCRRPQLMNLTGGPLSRSPSIDTHAGSGTLLPAHPVDASPVKWSYRASLRRKGLRSLRSPLTGAANQCISLEEGGGEAVTSPSVVNVHTTSGRLLTPQPVCVILLTSARLRRFRSSPPGTPR